MKGVKRLSIKVANFVLAISCAIHPIASAATDQEYQTGLRDYQQKRYKSAEQHFWKSITDGNNSAHAWLYLAHSRLASGDKHNAIKTYKEIAKIFHGQPAEAHAQAAIKRLDPHNRWKESDEREKSKSSPKSATAYGSSNYGSQLPQRARVFYRADGDDIKVPVRINGRSLEMEFDTGAPDVCLAKSDLTKLGMRLPTGKPTGYTGGSANSVKIPYWEIKSSVQVGPIKKDNLTLTVFEKSATNPLLGQEFFRDFNYTIDHKAKCVEFVRKDSVQPSGSRGYSIPFTFRKSGSRIVVQVEINGRKGPAMLDTGNTADGISFDSVKQMEKYGVKLPANARIGRSIGVSGSGSEYKFTLDRVRLGPIEKSNLKASAGLEISPDDEELPLLGQDMLKGWQYSIDMKKKVINFLRR